MTAIRVFHYEAFSPVPGQGNPAGVMLDADGLTDTQMQRIAAKVGFNETTFVCRSEAADVQLRYFTPGHEMDLCGHATMASLYALHTRGRLERSEAVIETKAGLLPVELRRDPGGSEDSLFMRMRQADPVFLPFEGDRDRLLALMGLSADDVDDRYPIVYGSTGVWTVLIPLRKLEAFSRMVPDNAAFPDVLTQQPRASLHPFCMETVDPGARMHARHFSSPFSGMVEDPATGTATGVMGAYALTYMEPDEQWTEFVVEQGIEMGRGGRIKVEASRRESGEMEILVSGQAVFVGELEIELE